jgi:hypothetical protein
VWKFTPIWQLLSTPRDAGQLFEASGVKSAAEVPVIVAAPTGSGLLPVFVTVTVCAVLVTPGPWAANVRLAGLTLPDVTLLTVPFSADDCVPTESVTDRVAGFRPAAWPEGGRNCRGTTQTAVGARVV